MDPKLPPQEIEAERSVLGALMLDKNAIIKVADLIMAEDFYRPNHAKIYECILELFNKNEPIDVLSVTNKLKTKNQLTEIGGSSYLTEIINSVPTAAHIGHYAKLIRDKKVLRDLISASAEIAEKVFGRPESSEDLLDEIEQRIFSIAQKSHPQNFVLVKDELKSAYERIEKIHRGDKSLRGVSTGFEELDHYLSGFQRSDLVVLGARPSLGKTAFAMDIARGVAAKGHGVAIFSLEMSKDQIIDRLISAEAQVPLWRLRTGRLTDEVEFEMIQSALDKLSEYQIYVDDTASPTVLQLRSMARRLQVECPNLSLIIIDYVQLIAPRTNSENIVQQFTEISHGLKAMARELNLPILAVSQLSRSVDHREVKIPRLSDLRETGSWEQDADVVMFIYRKDRDKLNPTLEEENMAEIIIAKHRNGPLGTAQLKFDPEKVSFKPIDKTHQ
ncbi:MAG: Replicative DNA helicase [Candidatus Wolfebacteria bacterium GW2011_GWA2_42_10]|uniref:Replicative DNA helicase n=2 Tax=Candidatus Wolfeibacteriota TaxID=1752735 RepID=A0A0G0ZU40_9BACT|nr:MAG: Replicative DNA helicase [Candidatus Wolfebacteria bacterium GW2011_GWB1_41_12]KKS25516.1 MAG: Replicative DNA helicase [Candidatus Wolfebacteria bacterium GW2011_GWA2_42_10]KKT56598.1 MAG: Replicative DNA helicase [Candidatus Wolfebacteria bacterium GW2011_GWA1_44_24]